MPFACGHGPERIRQEGRRCETHRPASREILRAKRVSDATYRRAVAKFGEQGVIDLLDVVGY